jgi:thiamine phosphate synthase YjbQ (UPF0047 family)
MVSTVRLHLSTSGQGDAHDITAKAAGALKESGLTSGAMAPRRGEYRHHLRWGDDNGSSHVRAALLGPSLTIPFVDRMLTLGTWQQIMVIEFDTRARRREIVVQMIGE